MLKKKSYSDILVVFLTIIVYLSFIIGFYLDENSAGAGGYNGDFALNWNNLKIFLNNDFFTSINLTDGLDLDNQYRSSRSPLVYILHSVFNPFVETEINYRRSVFLISLLGPLLFYFCLNIKFEKENRIILFFISSLILLSPYYRTSSYWALDENYGYISLFLGFIFFNLFLKEKQQTKKYIYLFFLTLFSSSCIYFDQKLLFIPLIFYLSIIISKQEPIVKFLITVFYIIFSIPFLYLVYLWGNIITDSVEYRGLGEGLYFQNIGYVISMIAFYFLPFLFIREKNIYQQIRNFLKLKINYYLIFIFFLYIVYLVLFFDITTQPILGKGMVHKLSLLLFEHVHYQSIFTYFAFFVSWLVILLFLNNKVLDTLILIYFTLISLISLMFLQEYLDPLLLILIFLFFRTKLVLNYKMALILFVYFSTFLSSSIIFYF